MELKNNITENDRKFYSDRHKILLMSLVEKFKYILENKKTDGTNLQKKSAAWKKICDMYNRNDVFPRTEKQLKKLWDNLKQRTRKLDSNIKKTCIETGGGPPPPEDKDPLNEMVRAIVPTIGLEIENPWDSTALIISERKQQTFDRKQRTENSECDAILEVDPKNASFASDESSTLLKPCENNDVAKGNLSNVKADLSVSSKRKYMNECSTPSSSKKTRQIIDEEATLRVKKIQKSLEQMDELHNMKMEAAAAERNYWIRRTELLELLSINKENIII